MPAGLVAEKGQREDKLPDHQVRHTNICYVYIKFKDFESWHWTRNIYSSPPSFSTERIHSEQNYKWKIQRVQIFFYFKWVLLI